MNRSDVVYCLWLCSALLHVYIYRSSQMHVHVIIPLFPENLEVHPIISEWKITFKKCNAPDFKFYLCKLYNKTFTHMLILSLFSLQ